MSAIYSIPLNSICRTLRYIEWCVDWSLRVNGNKCGVIHFRRKGEERSKASFNVGQEAIRMVQEYKYPGCVVDEYLEYKSMIEARAKAGMKALYAWLQRCRACVGELRRGTFGKLLEMLVGDVWSRGLGMLQTALGRLSKCSCEPCESSWELEGCTPKCLTGGNGGVTIRVGSETEVCGILV